MRSTEAICNAIYSNFTGRPRCSGLRTEAAWSARVDGSRYSPPHSRQIIMVKFMPDPLSREELEALKQIGVLPVKMEATNQRDKSLLLLGFANEVLGRLQLSYSVMSVLRMAK